MGLGKGRGEIVVHWLLEFPATCKKHLSDGKEDERSVREKRQKRTKVLETRAMTGFWEEETKEDKLDKCSREEVRRLFERAEYVQTVTDKGTKGETTRIH